MAKKKDTSKNLKPVQSVEEAREKGRKGGIRSGEVRRKKRDMQQAARMLLDMNVAAPQGNIKAVMKSLGIPEDEFSYQMGIMAAMVIQASNGNVKAATFLRDTAGDNPILKAKQQEESEETLADVIEAAYKTRTSKRGGKK